MKNRDKFKKAFDELGEKINLLAKDVREEYKEQVEDLRGRWNELKKEWKEEE